MIQTKDYQAHWDRVYANTATDRLGWYEAVPEPSLQLIQDCQLSPEATILNVGAGATTLVDELLKLGFRNLIVNDVSPLALGQLQERLGAESQKVRWIVDDLTQARTLFKLGAVDLWHDRAVLHFFKERAEQDAYFQLLKQCVRPGGFVILAAFHTDGASTCSGLPVHRYDQRELAEKLGDDFALIRSFDHRYTMPSGATRKYIYTLFKRK
ncbi:class I SAM-dependent methyltransferase [Flavilitoribacter nigricans]|uniref:SAM-dependent methyltransferase n=1 Tax=Flavilitoribacter nigricans (strain ATCC 23147 / DSM 23189 / NBRC 102662 / NCIMB 1420 / SS-2) TaxID=1122177 RepID=A0A2D0N1X0_FLAN2|nr:class I SAM-dependent methyltransferase [Flavilitoribacter nigricans]PHN02495.1 SAM-dependent methyltransferase [Flavilitoribacter nigricans DSM 23189 = NBRC 102662]